MEGFFEEMNDKSDRVSASCNENVSIGIQIIWSLWGLVFLVVGKI